MRGTSDHLYTQEPLSSAWDCFVWMEMCECLSLCTFYYGFPCNTISNIIAVQIFNDDPSKMFFISSRDFDPQTLIFLILLRLVDLSSIILLQSRTARLVSVLI